jgi:Zn-dependent alcohol dehydrogenase
MKSPASIADGKGSFNIRETEVHQPGPERDLPCLFALYRKGELLLDQLVARTYALKDMLEGVNAKGVVLMSPQGNLGFPMSVAQR